MRAPEPNRMFVFGVPQQDLQHPTNHEKLTFILLLGALRKALLNLLVETIQQCQ